jgi:hypothetical protein
LTQSAQRKKKGRRERLKGESDIKQNENQYSEASFEVSSAASGFSSAHSASTLFVLSIEVLLRGLYD